VRRFRRFSAAREGERMRKRLGIGSVVAIGAARDADLEALDASLRTIPAIHDPRPDPIAPPEERP